MPFAWYWMAPDQLKNFAQSLVAVSIFSSNILFWKQSGYFAAAAEEKPLLHTWSLAVEEQYYVFFPLLIMAFWFLGRRWLAVIVALLALISLGLAQFGGNIKAQAPFIEENFLFTSIPDWGFYLTPARAWELFAGSLCAFYLIDKTDHRGNQWLSLLGLVMIGYSIAMFSSETPFPSLYTLVPVVGTALIVLYATPNTLAERILSQPAFVGIGLISYSAYLWHQPLFAFARIKSFHEPSAALMLALAVAAFGLAWFSWRYVEHPFRDRQKVSRRTIFAAAICATVPFLGFGLIGNFTGGFDYRYADIKPQIRPVASKDAKHCGGRWQGDVRFRSLQYCDFGAEVAPVTALLYGDSHAEALLGALGDKFKENDVKGIRVKNMNCHPIPRVFSTRGNARHDLCTDSNAHFLNTVRRKVDYIVVSIRWTYRLFPIPGEIERLDFDNGEGGVERHSHRENYTLQDGVESTAADGKRQAVGELLTSLLNTGKKVILLYPVPPTGWDIPEYNFKYYINHDRIQPDISTSHAVFKARNRFVNDLLDGYGDHPNLVRIRPEAILCDTFVKERCAAQINGTPLYYDDDHLSYDGAKLVVAEVVNAMRQNLPKRLVSAQDWPDGAVN